MNAYKYCDTPLPCPPGKSPFHIKGEFYRNIAESMTHLNQKLNGKLSEALQAVGLRDWAEQQFLASSFYDVLPLPRIMMVMADVQGRDLLQYTEKLALVGAKQQLTGVYKSFFGTMTTRTFASRFDQVLSFLYDFGPVTIQSRDHGATLTRREMPLCVAEWWNTASVPYLVVPLENSDAKDVRVTTSIHETGEQRDGIPMGEVTWDVVWS